MRLSLTEAVEKLNKPKNSSLIAKGRVLENRHKLHILGTQELLNKFLAQHTSMESDETYKTRLLVSPPATKPIYAQIKNVYSKVFTAYGTNLTFNFTNPTAKEAYLAYINDTSKYGKSLVKHIETMFADRSLTGFQGVFMVDLPGQVPDGFVEVNPFVIYIPSVNILDIDFSGDKIEYLVIMNGSGENARYFVLADNATYQFQKTQGDYQLVPDGEVENVLGYVPACPPTTFIENADTPALRTSIVAPSFEVADTFLRDHSEHEVSKLLHAFPKFWSYAIDCEFFEESDQYGRVDCSAEVKGYLSYGEGNKKLCPNCKGTGKFIPTGPDKSYLLKAPESKDAFDARPVAGYIVPDIESIQYLKTCVETGEDGIEKSALGTEGYLTKTTKITTATEKDLDMEPIKATLNRYGSDLEFVVKFCLDSIAKLQYEAEFVSSSIHYGKKYFLKSLAQLEEEYAAAKLAGLPNTILIDYLEEIILVRHRDDPSALERNMLKLCLTPFPTMTEMEFSNATYITQDDKTLRAYLNDYIEQFEQDNGDIIQFGSLISKEARIARIKAVIEGYNAKKLLSIVPPAPVVTGAKP